MIITNIIVFCLNRALSHEFLSSSSSWLGNKRFSASNSRRSSEDEGGELLGSNVTIESGGIGGLQRIVDDSRSTNDSLAFPNNSKISSIGGFGGEIISVSGVVDADQLEQLTKQSYYDSGIDIREPIPNIQPIPKKTVYSDADIVLSSDWVPPKQIPLPNTIVASQQQQDSSGFALHETARKKTSSVSFSVEDSGGGVGQQANASAQGDKKNKVNSFIIILTLIEYD